MKILTFFREMCLKQRLLQNMRTVSNEQKFYTKVQRLISQITYTPFNLINNVQTRAIDYFN